MLGKIEGRRRRGRQRMRWLDGSTNSVDVDLSKFPGDGEGPWSLEAQFMESRSDLATGPQQPSASRWQWNASRVAQIKHCHKNRPAGLLRRSSCCVFLFTTFHGKLRRRQSTPRQYSCLGNPMDGGAWWAAVHGVAKSRTRLGDLAAAAAAAAWEPLRPFLTD